MSKYIRTLALLIALPLTGCGDSTGPDKSNGARSFGGGSITASFAGAKSGTLNASGKLEIDAKGNAKGSYAFALFDKSDPRNSMLMIQGYQARSGTRGDAILLALFGSKLGTYRVGMDCYDEDETVECAFGLIGLDIDMLDDMEVSPNSYSLESGQIQLTKLTSSDAEGTFTGTAYLTDRNTGEPTGEPLEVSNGKFSVKLVDIREFMNGSAFGMSSTGALTSRAAALR